MECLCCKKIHENACFLPNPGSSELHNECIFCMKTKHEAMASFLNKLIDSKNLQECLSNIPTESQTHIRKLTCFQKVLGSIEELKKELIFYYARPNSERRTKQLLEIGLKCAIDSDCTFQAMAIEKPDNSFIFQVINSHNCDLNSQNFKTTLHEIEMFYLLMSKLEIYLTEEDKKNVNALPMEYKTLSSVYKKMQQELHDVEDQAVKKTWGIPCNWRRARGQVNLDPTNEDVECLKQIVMKHNLESVKYVEQNFLTSVDNTYFQQRGYFLLLACSDILFLEKIVKKRIKIMYYAQNLLKEDMFLLCYKKLNRTILRNHVWMIILFIKALNARKNNTAFPLMGRTQPIDSESQNLYDCF